MLRLEQLGLSFQHWHLDDGILCGKVEVVAKAVDLLRDKLSGLGLELSIDKCLVVGKCVQSIAHTGLA